MADSYEIFFNKYSLEMLNESIFGNIGWVYHRTRSNPENSSLLEFGINSSTNLNAVYGTGFYATYKLEDQLRGHMVSTYGKNIIKGKIDLSKFVILDRDVYNMSRNPVPFEKYLKNIQYNLPDYVNQVENPSNYRYDDNDEPEFKPYNRTAQIAKDNWKQFKKNGYRGMVFTGRLDGHVVVIWDRNSFLPSSYSINDGNTWIKLNPNIKCIYRPIDEILEYDPQKQNEKNQTRLISKLPSSISKLIGNTEKTLNYISNNPNITGRIKSILLDGISKDPNESLKIAVEYFKGVNVPPIIINNIKENIFRYIDFLLEHNLPIVDTVISTMASIDTALNSLYIDKMMDYGISFNSAILSKIYHPRSIIKYINIFLQRGEEIPYILYSKIGKSKEYTYIADLLFNDKIDRDILVECIPYGSNVWRVYYQKSKLDRIPIPDNIFRKLLEYNVISYFLNDPFDASEYVIKYSDFITIPNRIYKLIATDSDAALDCISQLLAKGRDVSDILWESVVNWAITAKMFTTEESIPYSSIPPVWKRKLIEGGLGWMFNESNSKSENLLNNGVKSFLQFFLEYRHNLADGTSTPSIQAHNGKDPNRIGKKILHTVGDYKKMNPKMNIPGSLLTPKELSDMGITYNHGKIFDNIKNSGFGIEMTSINGQPMGRVFKSNVK